MFSSTLNPLASPPVHPVHRHHGHRFAQNPTKGATTNVHEARREFSSAPISKRFDIFTLETLDSICVAIIGFIKEQNTI
ncbi:hypothetical protein DVH24_001678 [Malus domestica]|uniref:SANTA domain-containing protein n=1 Tax=Malus domestica TaxID=3750 RepID=A0A498I4L4_MALDO|nr:hypothetical protein DVH24_001678 [Malus domestica]